MNPESSIPEGLQHEISGGKHPYNPEFAALKAREAAITEQLREVLSDGESAETPFDVQYDEEGKLTQVLVNGIAEGRGKLGQIPELAAAAREEYKGNGERKDKFLLEAYKNDERVRDILDAAIPLSLERNKIRNEDIPSEYEAKFQLYKKGSEINKLLEHLGSESRVPEDFDYDQLIQDINDLDPAGVSESAAIEFGQKLKPLVEAFSGLELPGTKIDLDYLPDAQGLKKVYQGILFAWSDKINSDPKLTSAFTSQYKYYEDSWPFKRIS